MRRKEFYRLIGRIDGCLPRKAPATSRKDRHRRRDVGSVVIGSGGSLPEADAMAANDGGKRARQCKPRIPLLHSTRNEKRGGSLPGRSPISEGSVLANSILLSVPLLFQPF